MATKHKFPKQQTSLLLAVLLITAIAIVLIAEISSTGATIFNPIRSQAKAESPVRQLGDIVAPVTTISPDGRAWINADIRFMLTCTDNQACAETKYSIVDVP
jgi:hypothetical protein